MKKILFNNIGNRHLRYTFINEKGESKNLYDKKIEFKKQTQDLLNNYEKEKEKITLEILRQYLDNTSDKPDEIILFGTDQERSNHDQERSNSDKSGQDTYWAALIIKKIIEEKYNIPVRVEKIDQNPSDEDKLVALYQKFFFNLKKQEPDTQWIFLDAGGTPQQKLVCKLLMPEINENTAIEYLENVEGVNEQDLKEKKQEEIKKIYALKNSKVLLDKGHYQSALDIIKDIDKKNQALPVIEIASYRINNIYKNVSLKKAYLKHKPVQQYINKIAVSDNEHLKESLSTENFFIYTEFIARADYYLKLKNYNRFILTFNQSLENILQSFLLNQIEKQGRKYEGKEREKISKFIKEELKKDDNNIPNQLELAIKLSENTVKKLFELYGNINSGYQQYILGEKYIEGLDILRNHLVHRGISVDTKTKSFKNIVKAFNAIKTEINLDENSYLELNFLAKELIFMK